MSLHSIKASSIEEPVDTPITPLLDLICRRRAVKHYDPTYRLTEDEIRTLLTAGALAPTSFNMQNRHFICVVDPKIKDQLSVAAWGQEQVRDASVVIVLSGNRNAYKNTARYLRNVPPSLRQTFETMIVDLYKENDALGRDEDCRSVAFAGMNIMLMATDMGYESGPLIGFDPEKVSEIIGLPNDHEPLLLIVIGKGTKPPRKRLGLLNFEEMASVDRFGQNAITGEVEADVLDPEAQSHSASPEV